MLKNFRLPVVLGVALVAAFVQGSFADSRCLAQGLPTGDESPGPAPAAVTAEVPSAPSRWSGDESPDAVVAVPAGEDAASPAGVTTRELAFSPEDSDGTVTVISLLNTTGSSQVVLVQAFAENGSLTFNLSQNVAPHQRLRLVSDSVAASPPPSWDATHAVSTNFTDFSSHGRIVLPDGVAADGYFAFNLATGVVDPRADQGAIPLRFLEVSPVCSRQLFFSPEDNDATATVITLYNTTAAPRVARLLAYQEGGGANTFYLQLAPHQRLHLASDSVAASPPPSWDATHAIVANFTDFSSHGTLTVPPGVGFDGYVLYNPGTGVVDPRADQGAAPLDFTDDPGFTCVVFADGFESGNTSAWSASLP